MGRRGEWKRREEEEREEKREMERGEGIQEKQKKILRSHNYWVQERENKGNYGMDASKEAGRV